MIYDNDMINKPSILLIGIGGAGNNILHHIYTKIKHCANIDFLALNTDMQALKALSIPLSDKLLMGESLTRGLGAGADPRKGKDAAIESSLFIQKKINQQNYKIAFIITGMGGGTGTGASPIIAKLCKNTGIYTIAICSTPFSFEGILRQKQATIGIEELKNEVDNIAIFSNDNIINSQTDITLSNAFSLSDEIFYTPIEIILSTINTTGIINIDFADILTTLKGSKLVTIASGTGQGKWRITKALKDLRESPFIQNLEITKANKILIYITFNETLIMDELRELQDFFQNFNNKIEIIWGIAQDKHLSPEKVKISAIITGVETEDEIIEYSNLNEVSIRKSIPKEIEQEVTKIRNEFKKTKMIAFLIMKFGTGKFYDQIYECIQNILAKKNIIVLRADYKEYHTDLYYNILSYIYAADFGIAVFERIEDEIYNPNVAFEVGFMTALNKPVCLLKEKTLKNLPTDIIGKLYKTFDISNLEESLDKNINKWTDDRGI